MLHLASLTIAKENEFEKAHRASKKTFKCIQKQDIVKFKQCLSQCDPNARYVDTPLLHVVVSNAGPLHLQALIEAGADVNAANTKNNATALQWITGLMFDPHRFYFGWPRNHESHESKDCSWTPDGTREVDSYVGTANEIMHDISKVLLAHGAHLDFYSACALGDEEKVKEYLIGDPGIIFEPGPDASSALAWAARRGQNHIISLLLDHGHDVNYLNTLNKRTPLIEAMLCSGTKSTITLLIERGALITKGIISRCGDSVRMDMIDHLLSHVKDPSSIVIADDVNCFASLTSFKKFLVILSKYHVNLTEIDRELSLLGERPLIFSQCNNSKSTALKLLISLGVNINALYPKRYVAGEEFPEYVNAKPITLLYLELMRQTKHQDYRLAILNRMAILFYHGSDVTPTHAIQPHPIKELIGHDLLHFLIFLHHQVASNLEAGLWKVSSPTKILLKQKINEALELPDQSPLKDKLDDLYKCCDINLMMLSMNSLFKTGALRNVEALNIPGELKEKVRLLSI